MITITNERLNNFVVAGKNFVNTQPKSLLWYAIDEVLRPAIKKLKKVEASKDAVRRKFALKDSRGIFEVDAKGGFRWKDEDHDKMIEALENIDQLTVEIPEHVVTEFEELSFDYRNAFEGIVIPAADYENFDWSAVK